MSEERDDDPDRITPHRARPRYAMSDAERSARRMSDSERGRRVYGVPIAGRRAEDELGSVQAPSPDDAVDVDADVTSPMTVLLERPLAAGAAEKIQRLRRESPDPYELAFRIAEDVTSMKRRHRSGSREQEQSFFTLIDVKPEEFQGMVRSYRSGRRFLNWVAGGTVAALLVAVAAIWNRSAAETSARKDLEFATRQIDELKSQITYLTRRLERDPFAAPPFPTTKGP